eukprot:scaffold163745_cov19-Prasinocladus_malaysianus.AAC.2
MTELHDGCTTVSVSPCPEINNRSMFAQLFAELLFNSEHLILETGAEPSAQISMSLGTSQMKHTTCVDRARRYAALMTDH